MYHNKRRRCDDRNVSLHQPHVRPIVRGKANQAVEFGVRPSVRLSVSLTGDGLVRVDRIRWDAFHEGADLQQQVEAYKAHHGANPERVHADPIYRTWENRAFLQAKGTRYAGKPLGRPQSPNKTQRD